MGTSPFTSPIAILIDPEAIAFTIGLYFTPDPAPSIPPHWRENAPNSRICDCKRPSEGYYYYLRLHRTQPLL